MGNTFTKRDMTEQVIVTLDGIADEYDVSGIVDDLVDSYGVTDVNSIPSVAYWDIVADRAR